MKRSAPYFFLIAAFCVAAPLAAKAAEPRFNTVVIRHFTNANGMTQSQEFIQYFSDDLCKELMRIKISIEAVNEGTAVPEAVAANSLVLDGKFLSHESGGFITPGKLNLELSLYRLSDHALVKTWNGPAYFMTNADHRDKEYAFETAHATAGLIWQALKDINMSTIPPAAPGNATTATGAAPASGTAPTSPESVASVQLSSDPVGAEITIDGNYVGSTPSTVNLKAGTHAIKMTMTGYLPWVRSIETEGGETRNFIADLTKAKE